MIHGSWIQAISLSICAPLWGSGADGLMDLVAPCSKITKFRSKLFANEYGQCAMGIYDICALIC